MKTRITKTDNGYECSHKDNDEIYAYFNGYAYFLLSGALGDMLQLSVYDIDQIIDVLRTVKSRQAKLPQLTLDIEEMMKKAKL